MEKKWLSQLLGLLSGATMAFSPGVFANADLDSRQIPDPVVEDFLETVDGGELGDDDLIDISWAFADDPRRNVRRALPGLLKKIKSHPVNEELGPILQKLAMDNDVIVREDLAPVIATWLSRLENLSRTEAIVEWALSKEENVRQTLARALSYGVDAFGLNYVVDHLANDESSAVRAEIEAAKEAVFKKIRNQAFIA